MQKYILFFLTALLISCSNNQKQKSRFSEEQISSLQLDSTKILTTEIDSLIKVDLNPFLQKQHFDFGSLIKEVRLVPLETTDESLVDDILKILVTEQYIYIMDDFKGSGIAIFDKNGKFVKRIPHGQGPGELYRLYDIAYDAENNELIAYQHPYLIFYTSSGIFLRQKKLPFGFYNFTVIPSGYIFKTLDRQGNGHLEHLEDYTLFITDKEFRLNSVGLFYSPKGSIRGGYNYLYNNGNTITITQGYTDTIYQFIRETNTLKAKYVLDYSKKKLPESYLYLDAYSKFNSIVRQNDYYFYIGEKLDTEYQTVFFLMNDYIGLKTIIYMDKLTGHLIGGTNADFNMNEIPSIGFPSAVSGNYFISVHLSNENDSFLSNSSIITEEDKKKIKSLTEDNNPVLVFFQLKNF